MALTSLVFFLRSAILSGHSSSSNCDVIIASCQTDKNELKSGTKMFYSYSNKIITIFIVNFL